MALAAKQWKPISIHRMVLEFLRAERHKFPQTLHEKIDSAQLEDHVANHFRLWMLYRIRGPFLGEIPPDTEWFEVADLEDEDFTQIHVIARCGWDDSADQNELVKVGARRAQTLRVPPSEWAKVILWGHSRQGPFTILEGNNRLTSYVSSTPNVSLRVPVIVGLSPTPCVWHYADPPNIICNDLWKSRSE